jgi:hypothetical protein
MLTLEELARRAREASAEKSRKADRPRAQPDSPPTLQPEWRAEGLVFLIEEWECASCGAVGEHPLGAQIRWTHLRYANTTRLTAPRSESDPDLNRLPRHFHYTTREVSICPKCCADHGFATALPEPMTPAQQKAAQPVEGAGFVEEWKKLRAPAEYPTEPLQGESQ